MELRTLNRDGTTIVEITGEFDMYNAAETKPRIKEAFEESSGVVVDLSGVEYIDSSGIGVLLFAVTESRRKGNPFLIAGTSGQVQRVIELTSLTGVLPMIGTVDEAIEAMNH